MRTTLHGVCLIGIVLTSTPCSAQTPAPEDAELYFISPRDGAKLRGPITVRFGLKHMGVTHAGDTTPNMATIIFWLMSRSRSAQPSRFRRTSGTSISDPARPKLRWIFRRDRTRCNWSWEMPTTNPSNRWSRQKTIRIRVLRRIQAPQRKIRAQFRACDPGGPAFVGMAARQQTDQVIPSAAPGRRPGF